MSEFLPSRIRARVRKSVIRRSKPIPITVQSKFLMEEAHLLYDLADFVKTWILSSESKSTDLFTVFDVQLVSFYDSLTSPKSHLSMLGKISKIKLTRKVPKKGAPFFLLAWTLDVSAQEKDPLEKIKRLNNAFGTNGVLCCSFAEGGGHQQEIPGADNATTKRKPGEFDAIGEEILAMIDKSGQWWIEDVEEMTSVESVPTDKARRVLGRVVQQLLKDGKIAEVEKRASPRPEANYRKVSVYRKALDL